MDANIVKTLGCRPVPLVQNHQLSLKNHNSDTVQPGSPLAPGFAPSTASEPNTAQQTNWSTTAASTTATTPNDRRTPEAEPQHPETSGVNRTTHPDYITDSTFSDISRLFAVPRPTTPDESESEVVYGPDFVCEFEYSEYTLACCTPLPECDGAEEEEDSLGGGGYVFVE